MVDRRRSKHGNQSHRQVGFQRLCCGQQEVAAPLRCISPTGHRGSTSRAPGNQTSGLGIGVGIGAAIDFGGANLSVCLGTVSPTVTGNCWPWTVTIPCPVVDVP
jgi:hypothetical protein